MCVIGWVVAELVSIGIGDGHCCREYAVLRWVEPIEDIFDGREPEHKLRIVVIESFEFNCTEGRPGQAGSRNGVINFDNLCLSNACACDHPDQEQRAKCL